MKFTREKILAALKEMGPLKAPGINDFSTLFYQKCWHIMGENVSLFCLAALNNKANLEVVNATSIVLILKKSNPTKMI